MNDNPKTETAQSWNTYWQGTGDIAAFSSGGVDHPAIAAFWHDVFRSEADRHVPINLLDVATGNGAILEIASSILDPTLTTMSCVDISEAAISNVAERYPDVKGIVADALSMPMEGEQFGLVTSQFGVEYAGPDAISEAARMVAPGGRLILMVHVADGLVHQECLASLTAIRELQAANFVPLAIDFFKHGFAAVRGADRRAYDEAGKRLAPAIQATEAIMNKYGERVAGDTIAHLYADVGHIHNNLPRFDANDVHKWLKTNEHELESYAERMSSMMKAAITAAEFRAACDKVAAAGLTLERNDTLTESGKDAPLAWILIASR
jgi:ubiquinone/menaquinone biosynthesis C-methylase UbiE